MNAAPVAWLAAVGLKLEVSTVQMKQIEGDKQAHWFASQVAPARGYHSESDRALMTTSVQTPLSSEDAAEIRAHDAAKLACEGRGAAMTSEHGVAESARGSPTS